MSEVDLGWRALGALAGISALSAAGTLLVFRRFSDQKALARAKNLGQAHLLEIRLFRDEPREVLRSEAALLRDQIRFLSLLIRPLLVLAIPMLVLFGELEGIFGHVPLRPGKPAVITVRPGGSAAAPDIVLDVPAGIVVEAPPVHIPATGEVSWRVRPLRAVSGLLEVHDGGRVFRCAITAGWGMAWGANPVADLLPHKIEIDYPSASLLGLPWLVWFLALGTIAGLLLRGPLRVAI